MDGLQRVVWTLHWWVNASILFQRKAIAYLIEN